MSEINTNTDNQALIPVTAENANEQVHAQNSDFSAQAQKYGQQALDNINKAKGYANEYIGQASDKIKDLQGKDFTQITEEAKDFARRKPAQAIAISAVAGLLLGFILRGRR